MRDAVDRWEFLRVTLQERSPDDRREAIEAALDEGYHLTDITLIEDRSFSIEVREVLTGWKRQDGLPQYDSSRRRDELITLRTVNGEPFGPVKVGIVVGDAKRLLNKSRRGLPLNKMVEYAPVFQVPIDRALFLLDQHGYGLVHPRYGQRNAEVMGETDLHGKPVKKRDKWKIVEPGSSMEELARENGDLAEAPPSKRSRKAADDGRENQRAG